MNRNLKQAVRLLKELRPQNPYVQNKLSVVIKLLTLPRKRPINSPKLPKLLQSTKPTRRAAHGMSTKEIRAACMERAKSRREACYVAPVNGNALQLDHWLSGRGRRRQMESVQTCWILCHYCHNRRTMNWPSAALWNEKFRAHCERHGYPALSHIEHKPLPRRTA